MSHASHRPHCRCPRRSRWVGAHLACGFPADELGDGDEMAMNYCVLVGDEGKPPAAYLIAPEPCIADVQRSLVRIIRPGWAADEADRVSSALDTMLYGWQLEPRDATVSGVTMRVVPQGEA